MNTIDEYIELANINFFCDCRSDTKKQNCVWARFTVFVAMRSSGYLLKRIAMEFNLNHATVINGLNQHENLYNFDKKYTEMFNKFKELTEHENITPKQKLITLIENLPDNNDLLEQITKHILRKHK